MRRNVRRLNREVGHITSELSAAAAPAATPSVAAAMMPTEMMPVLQRDGAGTDGKPHDPSFSSPQPESKNGKRPLKSRKAANLAGKWDISF